MYIYCSSLTYTSVLVANIGDARLVEAQISDLLLAARGYHTKAQSSKAWGLYALVQYMWEMFHVQKRPWCSCGMDAWCNYKIIKMSVLARTWLSVTNALIRMDTFTKPWYHYEKKRKNTKLQTNCIIPFPDLGCVPSGQCEFWGWV